MHGLPRKWSLTGIASAALFLGTLNVLVGKTMYFWDLCVFLSGSYSLDCLCMHGVLILEAFCL